MLVLASNSPRRRQLMALGGWTFTLIPAEVDESPLLGEHPKEYVLRLAESKARAAASVAPEAALVVAADTTVADSGEILGKPADTRQAEAMLRRLRGRSHQVFTALAVLRSIDGWLLTDWCRTEVPMRLYSDEELSAYIATGDPFDKAGAYGIQHEGFRPVELLGGCYANVMGLPLCHLVRTLREMGMAHEMDVPQACQAALQYNCPVYTQVLKGETI
jgi:nucleoside triphosphate pyrophosphatase